VVPVLHLRLRRLAVGLPREEALEVAAVDVGLRVVVRLVEEVAAREGEFLAPLVDVVQADAVAGRDSVHIADHEIPGRGASRRPGAPASAATVASASAAPATSGGSRGDHPGQILLREVQLVDVVRQAEDRDATLVVEDIDVAVGPVAIVGAVACGDLAEGPGAESGLGDDVDGLDLLAVVEARELGLLALLVEDLDAGDDIRRKVLQRQVDIAVEKLPAVDQHLLHLLALRLDRAALDDDARHLGQQLLGRASLQHLERFGIVDQAVAPLYGACGAGRDLDGIHRLDIRPHADRHVGLFPG